MKKNFTKYAGIALVALLTACNGSAITKDEAAKVAKGITTKQNSDEDFYSVFHINSTATGYEESKEHKEKFQTWVNNDKHFLHIVDEETDDGKTEKEEFYMGQIDDKFYEIDMVEKTYKEYSSLTVFEVVFKAKASESALMLVAFGTGEGLEATVATAKEEPGENDPVYEFKSKGEGHLYVGVTQVRKDEENNSEIKTNGALIFDDSKIRSYEFKATDDKTKDNNSTMKLTFDYNVNVKMPSLNGLTKK